MAASKSVTVQTGKLVSRFLTHHQSCKIAIYCVKETSFVCDTSSVFSQIEKKCVRYA